MVHETRNYFITMTKKQSGTQKRILIPEKYNSKSWKVAILTFGVGDVATTYYGLGLKNTVEGNILIRQILINWGFEALVLIKIAAFIFFYAFYKISPKEIRIGVPLGLCFLGTTITIWNLIIISI